MYRTFLVKVGLLPFKENRFIYLNESPLKIKKMPFYFMLKVLLLRKYLNFCLNFLVV